MELTGYDYILFSQQSIFSLKNKIMSSMTAIWPTYAFNEESEDDTLWLFFGRDADMLNDPDIAYELDNKGEGCFSIIAHSLKGFDATVPVRNADSKDICDIKIMLTDFWSYTLVLPARINDSSFCEKIYSMLVSILSQDIVITREENKNELIPRAVQDF